MAVIRKVIAVLPLAAESAAALRSLAGHIVAGTASPEEERDFAAILNRFSAPPAS